MYYIIAIAPPPKKKSLSFVCIFSANQYLTGFSELSICCREKSFSAVISLSANNLCSGSFGPLTG